MRDKPVLVAAPLAGVSDVAYRRIVKQMGADYAFPEMVSSEGLIRKSRKTFALLRTYEGETAVGCQLFGTRPEVVAEAAKIVQQMGFNSIDLNCGCPVHKIVNKCGGAALLKDPPLLGRIVAAASRAVSVPFTVKIRSGWDHNSLNYLEIGRIAEESGAASITLHARTQDEYFAPEVHWDHIRELKQSLSIPVIGNGNIHSAEDAVRMLSETACDGVMVASGTLGNPFIFREIKALLSGRPLSAATTVERAHVCLEHLRGIIQLYGEYHGIRRARKLIGWYYRRITGRRKIDQELFQLETYAQVEAYLQEALSRLQEDAA